MPRPQRHDQILSELCRAYLLMNQQGGGGWLTRGQIAKAVGMAKSPHFLSILAELEASAWIKHRRRTDRLQTHEYKATAALVREYKAGGV